MRVALVITELLPGGAEKCFVNLACFLHSRGHDVCVWQLWPTPPNEKSLLTQQLDQHGIRWKSGNAVRAWDFWIATRWLSRELKSFDPHIVQSFLFHGNVAAAIATRKLNCKFFGGARVAQPERWRQLLQRWSARRMKKLVCVSASVANHCQHVEGIAAQKLISIPNGIELPAATQIDNPHWKSLGVPNNARILLYVGRITDQKGIVEFLRSHANHTLAELPQHRLVIMGDGEQQELLAQLSATSPHRDRIHLVGWQANAIRWMQQAELLILPTKYEGMPNVIMEAMSVGKPVVAFDVDGVRELIGTESAATAQVVPPQDWDRFAAQTIAIAESADLQTEIGRANRSRIEGHFQLHKQLAQYEQLYLRHLECS